MKYYTLFCKEETKNIFKALENDEISPDKASETMELLREPKWDEWIKFMKAVKYLNTDANQFILISGEFPDKKEANHYSVLGRIQWRAVFDLDPGTEGKGGLLTAFKDCKGREALFPQHTPRSLNDQPTRLKNIESHQTQWVFVNGRNNDADNKPMATTDAWKKNYGAAISRFIDSCTSKFDNCKPVVCLITPLARKAKKIAVEVLEMLEMFLNPKPFRYSFVCLNEDLQIEFTTVKSFTMSPRYLRFGLLALLGNPQSKYLLPSAQSKNPIQVNELQYLFFQGYLEPLYIDCQRLPKGLSKEEIEQLKAREEFQFLSGNPISFLSLYYNQDARRVITKEIEDHLRSELSTLCKTKVEEICHAPGTGGTTIARRLLWELHRVYPCAIADVSPLTTISILESEADSFITGLIERIKFLHELCDRPPVILIDGKSFMIDALKFQLERKLTAKRTKAILLCCVRPKKQKRNRECSHVVHSNLENWESEADLDQFNEKFSKYMPQGINLKGATRVFHFPLLALIEQFHPKLKEIVNDSLQILKSNGYEYEVVVVVAFILLYAEQPTPAQFLYKMFKENYDRGGSGRKTPRLYKDIKLLFSESLLNLMINKKSRFKRLWRQEEQVFEGYTLQHQKVADFVLEHAGRKLHSIVQDLLDKPAFSSEEFRLLLNDLFIYNKGQGAFPKFSLLMNELTKESSPQLAGKVFCDVAKKTNDANFYSNAARFYVYVIKPPDFKKAEELIATALSVDNITDIRKKHVYDTMGVILKEKLRNKSTAIPPQSQQAEEVAFHAHDAIKAFRNARYEEFPNPLVGELEVLLYWVEWVITHLFNGDTKGAIKFMARQGSGFLPSAIPKCYDLLQDIEDMIDNNENLIDPKRTQELANNARHKLLTLTGTTRSKTKRESVQNLDLLAELTYLAEGEADESSYELRKVVVLHRIRRVRHLEQIPEEAISQLIELLKEIVRQECKYTYDLLRLGIVPSDKALKLDEALQYAQTWSMQPQAGSNPYPWLFIYIICFLKILEGGSMSDSDFRPEYESALKSAIQYSLSKYSRTFARYYLVDGEGQENSMTQLVTASQLESLYKTQNQTDKKASSEVQINDEFLKNHGRRFLRNCKGRIFAKKKTKDPYILTLTGNIEVYTPKTAVRLIADFEEGDIVSFVVSFSMVGPRAHGIEKCKIEN